MKKILIVTLQGDNIGNRLQNYALQRAIEDLGCKSYTIVNRIHEFELFRSRVKFALQVCLGKFGLRNYRKYFNRYRRIKKYNQFNKKYIHNMVPIEYTKAFHRDWNEFDYAITGSDQVWHRWSINDDELRYFYLEFMPKVKRVSYAPSFGFDKFPNEDIPIHLEGIQNINCLSCREEKGVKLIKELSGRDAKLVLDPTLLLCREDWEKIEKKPSWISKKEYILTYFLDKNHEENMALINKYASGKELEVVEALNLTNENSSLITPDEFIWLIHHASYVCTDSFHATVFSILFEKKFLSFRRNEPKMEKMFDRIETLLGIFELEDHIFEGSILKIESTYKKKNVTKKRQESINYLRLSLGLKD